MTLPSSVRLVRVDASHLRLFEAVADDVFDDVIDVDQLTAFVDAGQLMVVAVDDGTVVGQVQAMVQYHVDGPPQLYVDNLGVASSHQRRGIARSLVSDVVAWSSEVGCVETWILTDLDNDGANGFYRSIGTERSTVVLHSLDQGEE
ncbi:MAG: GNAT family N-acetyltransferase [Ilumatobacteraceae bacterium]